MQAPRCPSTEKLDDRTFHTTAQQRASYRNRENEKFGPAKGSIPEPARNQQGKKKAAKCAGHFEQQYPA